VRFKEITPSQNARDSIRLFSFERSIIRFRFARSRTRARRNVRRCSEAAISEINFRALAHLSITLQREYKNVNASRSRDPLRVRDKGLISRLVQLELPVARRPIARRSRRRTEGRSFGKGEREREAGGRDEEGQEERETAARARRGPIRGGWVAR